MRARIISGYIAFFLLVVAGFSFAQSISQSGKVAEVINVKSYTYLHLEEPDVWVATMPQSVAQGDVIEFKGGMEMPNFHSKSLQRTFESVIFVQTVKLVKQNPDKADSSTKMLETHGTGVPISRSDAVISPVAGDIVALEGGQTIATVHEKSDQLKTQSVKLRARVMKINKNIMGKNWITLQDGTGAQPDTSLLATSSEVVSPGDTVVVSGTLNTDIDLGSGYRYRVLLENARFSSE